MKKIKDWLKIKSRVNQWLVKSQSYIKLDVRYFAKGGFWLSFDHFIRTIASIILVVALANLLLPADYGVYKYIIAVAGIFEILMFKGMGTALVQSIAQGEEGAFKKIIRFRFRWTLLFTLALLIASSYYFIQTNYILATGLFLFAILSPLKANFNLYQSVLIGKKNFRQLAIFNISTRLTTVLLMVITLVLTKNILAIILVFLISEVIFNIIFFKKTTSLYHLKDNGGEAGLNYGKHLTATQLIGTIAGQIDNLLLFHYWGAPALAQYAIAISIPRNINSFQKNFVTLFIPKLSTKTTQNISKSFYKRLFQTLLISVLISIIYWLTIPFLIKILFSQYQSVIFYAQILAIEIALALPIAYIGSIFQAKRFIAANYISNISTSSFKIGLYVIMGIWGGLLGLVIARVISRIVGTLINILLWEMEKRKALNSSEQ